MGRYIKRKAVEAVQWYKNGDHPLDDPTRGGKTQNGEYWEGKLVRYYRHPNDDGNRVCQFCGNLMHDHGWIDFGNDENGQIVCPGDWIVKEDGRAYYPLKPNAFYESFTPWS